MTTVRNEWLRRCISVGIALLVVLLYAGTAQAKVTLIEKVGEKQLKLEIYGFGQLEARGGDGQSAEGGLFFKAQRLRLGFNYFHGHMASKLFLDFTQSYTVSEGGLPNVIKDAFVAYRWSNAAFIRLGMIKTPVGMSFTVPGWDLDNVERQGLDKGLTLERDFGLMLSGRLIGQEKFTKKPMQTNGLEMGTEHQGYGFGYDIGVFNPAGRSSAVTWNTAQLGDALAYAGRLHWDSGPKFHAEAGYGTSQEASGVAGSEDYTVFDVGVSSEWPTFEVKGEYINGDGIRGVKDWKQNTVALTFGYFFGNHVEAVVKHYAASSDRPGKPKADLGNTYVGLNFYIDPLSSKHRDLQRNRVIINYIIASGDTDIWAGIGGYKDDGWVVQYQYKF
jgi:hypothetical protein